MPIYDFSSGFNALNQGIGNLSSSLQNADKQARLQQLGAKLQAGDYDGAASDAFAMGDVQTGLALQQQKLKTAALGPLTAGLNGGAPTGALGPSLNPPAQDSATTGPAPTSPATGYENAGMSTSDIAAYITQGAQARGINPGTALAVAKSEGLGSYTGDSGSSFGPFQLHYGGVASGGNATTGLGDAFTKTTGLDARDPRTVRQQIDFALDHAAQNGWGPWHGWKGDQWAGIGNNAAPRGVSVANPALPGTTQVSGGFAPTASGIGAPSPGGVQVASANPGSAPQGAPPVSGSIGSPGPGGVQPQFNQVGVGGNRPIGAGISPQPISQGVPTNAAAGGASAPADAEPPDPPVTIKGKQWTRASAAADNSDASPEVADVAKAQGIPWVAGVGDEDPGHVDPSWKPARGPGAPPTQQAQAQLTAQIPGRPGQATAAIENSGASSQQKIDFYTRMWALAAQSGNTAYADIYKQKIDIEQKNLDFIRQQSAPTTYRSLIDPAARQAAGIAPDDTGIYQQDSHGRLYSLGAGRARVGPAGGAVGPSLQSGPPNGSGGAATPGGSPPQGATTPSLPAGPPPGIPRLSPREAARLPRGSHFIDLHGFDRFVR
ncbi:hypothetical protein SAMN05519103_00755 [Rhizobiales bacterium GAS113]|nr:hypothetical protein SAMN05519103_00755 [Rhizobiales bacterium GAS113]